MSLTAKEVITQGFRRNKKLLIWSLVLAIITQVFSLLDPLLFQIIVDDYALKYSELAQQEFVLGVLAVVAAMIGVAFVSRTAKVIKDYFVEVVSQRIGTYLYARSVDFTLTLPFSVFEDRRSGEVLQKIQKARDDVQVSIKTSINYMFLPLVGAFFVTVYAFFVHPYIGLAFVVLIPIITYLTYRISKAIKQAQRTIVKQKGELAGSTTESLRNVELVKSLGLEQQEITRLNKTTDEILNLEVMKARIVQKLSYVQGTAVNAARSGLLVLMLFLIFGELMTLGQLMTLYFYSFFIFGPLQNFGEVASSYQQAQASIELLEEVYLMDPREEPDNPKTIDSITEFSFTDVSFSYGDQPAVHKLNIQATAGETIALVGPSGSGKSTIVKLLLRLYDVKSGSVSYNDVDVSDMDISSLRQKVGFVTQETQLFAASIRENLLFVSPDASDAKLHEVLKLAQVDHIVSRSKEGLSAKIGEGGIKLSGGERQRLSIARALLRDPDLLIFDEATSSLDSATEKEINDTIRNISGQRPVISLVIAHRLSTVTHADRIYALKDGHVVESGSHTQLLKKDGLYASLWDLQQPHSQ